jgi:phage/plasmid-associated DNA primase
MTNVNEQALRPGEIRFEYIPFDWPLTPLGAKKDPYLQGWQNRPFTLDQIENEIAEGNCKAIGLLSGPVYNDPYGLVWVDVDGPSVYPLVEELAEETFKEALPPTLTILSGKEGRERKLYRLHRDKQKHFVRNKYVWHAELNREKLEILWSRHQGVLMGLHPETDGYYTAPGQGFEWASNLPELPDWLLNSIINKNVKQGVPAQETQRVVGANFAVQFQTTLERDITLAKEAAWGMLEKNPEVADDYDIWITVGQSLHSLDESLLDAWDEWSKQSEKYKEGECQKRWISFSKGGGRKLGTLLHVAKENGWERSQDDKALPVDDDLVEYSALLAETLENAPMTAETLPRDSQSDALLAASRKPTRKVDWQDAPPEDGDQESKPKGKPLNEIADAIHKLYGDKLKYSENHGFFYIYEHRSPGVWSYLSEIEMKGSIKDKLECMSKVDLPKGYSMKTINDVLEQLRISTIHEEWYEGNEYLLFTNGILDVKTRQLYPFDQSMYMTQQLPYDYDPGATCEPIIKWLKETQENNWGRVQVLRAWLRAVLLSHSEIQKFVEIVGPGKSGKSTYSNLAHALVGDDNAMISTLEHLEKNRFETANFYKKKLLLFNDVERYGGSVSMLKAITGRDLVRKERKFQTGSQKPFKFNGLVIITANEPIQTTDPTSGLARRRLTIPFDRPFTGSSAEQRTLIDMDDNGRPFGDFAPLIPGLVNWVLDLSETEMREYLMETTKKVDFFAEHHRKQILKSNQIMDWMDHCVVFDAGVSSPIGLAKNAPAGTSNIYSNWDKWLYASYCEFSRSSNSNILGRSRFETLLMDVCVHQLQLNVYSFKQAKRGMRVVNIACRSSDQKYEGYPSIVEVGLNKEEWLPHYGNVLYKEKNDRIEDDEEKM